MRGLRGRFGSDEGMTIIEVVVASAILFFIMTAILSLVSRTTLMAAQAKQMNDSNNALTAYVEWARSIPFDKVALTAAGGSLETTTIALGDYTVRVEPTNVTVNPNDHLKNVWLTITTTQPNGFSKVTTTMVMIHDRDQYLTQAAQGGPTDPSIVFLSASPPNSSAVWCDSYGSWWKDASGTTRPLRIWVTATANGSRTLAEVYLQCEGLWDLKNSMNSQARWNTDNFGTTSSTTCDILWDLKQKDTDGNPVVQEGIRSIYAYVIDSAGAIRYDMWQYCVDNLPPLVAPVVTWDDSAALAGTFSWPVVMDGTSPSNSYILDIRKQPLTPTTLYSVWTAAGFYTKYATSHVYTFASPMSRYCIRAKALSVRGLQGPTSSWMHFVTRPKLTGSYLIDKSVGKWWRVTPTLTATAPSFESTATSYAWYENGNLLATTTRSEERRVGKECRS